MEQFLIQRMFKGKQKFGRKPIGYIGCTKLQFSSSSVPIIVIGWSLCHKTDKWDAQVGRKLVEDRIMRTMLFLNSIPNPVDYVVKMQKPFPTTVLKNYHKMVDRAFKYYKIDSAVIAGCQSIETDRFNKF